MPSESLITDFGGITKIGLIESRSQIRTTDDETSVDSTAGMCGA